MKTSLVNSKNIILDVLFPRLCVDCKKEGKYICEKCELFLTESLNYINNLTSVWDYEGLVKKAIHQVKYKYTKDILNELIEKGFSIILNDKYRFNDFLSFLINEKPVITYVPMYKKKERYRGFNQSKIIARKFGEVFNLEVVGLLEKRRETKSQTKLNREQRFENVRHSVTNIRDVRHRVTNIPLTNILLVDDIYTTGATMEECERVLKKLGIKKIQCFTLAKTP